MLLLNFQQQQQQRQQSNKKNLRHFFYKLLQNDYKLKDAIKNECGDEVYVLLKKLLDRMNETERLDVKKKKKKK